MSTLAVPMLGFQQPAEPGRFTPEPTPFLALNPAYLSDVPMTFKMKGHATNPDFEVSFYHGSILFDIQTTSSAVEQSTFVYDGKTKTHLHTMSKATIGASWTYTIQKPDQNAAKVLELETKPKMFTGATMSRLVFRNVMDDQLDALDLRICLGSDGEESDVLYRGKKVAEIHQKDRGRRPEFILDILVPGIDPTLIVLMALAIDDRQMSDRRRARRSVKDDLKLAFRASP